MAFHQNHGCFFKEKLWRRIHYFGQESEGTGIVNASEILKKTGKYLVVGAILFFLFKTFFSEIDNLPPNMVQPKAAPFVLSLFLLVAVYYIQIAGWQKITKALEIHIDFPNASKIWIETALAKYVPGAIWSYAGRIYYYRGNGRQVGRVSLALFLEVFLILSASFLIFLPALLIQEDYVLPPGTNIIIAGIFSFSLLFLAAVFKVKWRSKLLNFAPVNKYFSSKEPIIGLREMVLWEILGIYFVMTLTTGMALWLLILSFHPVPVSSLPFVVGAYSIASLVSVLVVFAPAGIGVREGALSLLLSFVMPPALAVGISLLSRLWFIFAEILVFLFTRIVAKFYGEPVRLK